MAEESTSGAIQAGKAYVKAFLDDNPVTEGLERMKHKLEKWSETLEHIGGKAHGGDLPGPLKAIMEFAESPAGVFAGLSEAAKHTAEENEQLGRLSEKAGTTVEEFSKLAYAAKIHNVSADALAESLKNLDKAMFRAGDGAQHAGKRMAAALADMNIDPAKFKGGAEGFRQIVEEMGKYDKQSRVALAARLGIAEALPLINQGVEEIDRLTNKYAELGLVTTKADVEAAEKFGDAQKTLWEILDNSVQQIGGALIPLITRLTTWIGQATTVVRDWIKAHQGMVQLLFIGTGAVVGFGLAMYAGSYIMKIMAGAVGLVQTAITVLKVGLLGLMTAVEVVYAVISSPWLLLAAAIAGVIVWVGIATNAFSGFGSLFSNLLGDVNGTMEGITAAISKGDLALAWEIVCGLLRLEWERLKFALYEVWLGFKEVWSNSVISLAEVFNTVSAKIKTTWQNMLAAMKTMWADWKEGMGSRFVDFFEDKEVAAKTKRMEAAARAKGIDVVSQDLSAQTALHDDMQRERKDAATTRDKSVSDVEKDRRATESILEKEREEEARRRADAEAAAQKKIDAARAQLQALTDKAQGPEAEKEKKKEGDKHFEEASTHAVGTFSGAVASMLGGGIDQVQQQIAENTEDTVQLLEQIRESLFDAFGSVAAGELLMGITLD